jgi:hypothetical protein
MFCTSPRAAGTRSMTSRAIRRGSERLFGNVSVCSVTVGFMSNQPSCDIWTALMPYITRNGSASDARKRWRLRTVP